MGARPAVASMARCAAMGRTSSRFDPAAVEALFACAQAHVTAGKTPACQLAVARGDEVRSATFGAFESSRFVVFSLTKSLIAGALWLLFGEGSVAPTTRVVDLVPEFGKNGKDAVTVEHLLTHTGGFPSAPMLPEEGASSEGRVARFADWRLDWEPGTQSAYHPTSAHWVLAEIIERVSDTDYRTFVAERLVAPLGLSTLQLGVPRHEQQNIVPVTAVGAVKPSRGASRTDAMYVETAMNVLLRFNEPAVLEAGVPGAGAVGTAADFARYFQAMLHNPGGFWDPAVLDDATSHVRNALLDPLTDIPSTRTLGLMLAGDDGNAWMREFGEGAGPRSFLSSGAGGQVAWADPDTGLSFSYLTAGIDGDVVQSFLRSSELSTLAARCAPAG